ncbi:hypothetical protein AK830_g3392 [Neonectria ditissima]|uniref:Rhodopsin domain-containing protein n=1 Tax=Neonectria ditissima TaxID=78410 RepID=A0A0P7BQI2_9HYPO|nr:hypothetical protein AK830_g3392 [Neonectria ditissima]
MASDAAALAELLDTPAMEPPKGVTADFDNPPNQNGLAIAIITLTMVIATICLVLRLYARVYLLRKVQIEEVLIVSAYAVYWGQTYCSYALLETPGYFVHQWNLKFGQLVSTSYNVLLIGSFYQTVLPLLKTAILIEWCRIFTPTNRLKSPFWWGCASIITLQITWGVACVILLNVQCSPHESIWKFYLPRTCFNLVPVQLASGSVQLFSDVVMMILPQKTIWGLNLSWKKKLGVSVVFGLGIIACISAGFRLGVTVSYGYDADQMYQLGPVVFWVMAETTCGFFIVCMPTLPKIFKDTGVMRKIRQRMGLKVSTGAASGPSNSDFNKYAYGSKYGTGVSALSRTGTTADAYHKITEDGGVPLRNLKTESTEQLRHAEDTKSKIVRTTHVTVHVTEDGASQSGSDADAHAAAQSALANRANAGNGWYR